MIGAVRQWIVGVACAAVIGGAADCLMPEGSAKKAGRLAVGLLLLLAVVQPLAGLDYDVLAQAMGEYRLAAAGYAGELERENEALIKTIIEQQTAAYISDKAEELGMDCTARVVYHYGEDGDIWPESVEVRGSFTDSQREALSRALEAELAIPRENQTFERAVDE